MGVLTMDRATVDRVAAARPRESDRHARAEPRSSALRWRFTVAEYHQLIAAGIFGEDDRVELIGGDLVMMSPIGSKHAASVKRLNRVLGRLLQDRGLIGVQDPLQLDDASKPQPGIAVLAPSEDD
jgi:Uma2 family endonuclease